MLNVIPVILCGGSGSRLWPLSRAGFPKQFLVLTGTSSLFQQAVERVNRIEGSDIKIGSTLVVTNEEHRFLSLSQIHEFKDIDVSLILEPTGRNTAPALTLAALKAIEYGEDPILIVTPADHIVQNASVFKSALQQSIRVAADGGIVTLGITPEKPETGYGYIEQFGAAGKYGQYKVAKFVEKPNLNLAKTYLADGLHTWNSGIFVMRATTWLKAIQHFRPDIYEVTQLSWKSKSVDFPFIRPNKEIFIKVPAESIDYAVMEKCPTSKFPIDMVRLDAGWNDLGSWESVWQTNLKSHEDNQENVVMGDAVLIDTFGSFIHSSRRLIGTVGVRDLIIVETADVVLVTARSQSQNVKKLVNQLESKKRKEIESHRKVQRPWGWYDSIDEGERFKVKRIFVNPGASLSLQKHSHRAEHWIVVKGTAEITNGEKLMRLTENQSTYIEEGTVHRLSNIGNIPLEIIEVQSGSYLGEDDIVRIDDIYGRKTKGN